MPGSVLDFKESVVTKTKALSWNGLHSVCPQHHESELKGCYPVEKWFHLEIRFYLEIRLGSILSLGAGVNGGQPFNGPLNAIHSIVSLEKWSSKVQTTSLCTNSWGSSEKCSFHKVGSHKHSLFGLNSVGPTFKIQDISHKKLDFWLLLKRLRSGSFRPIFPHDNNWQSYIHPGVGRSPPSSLFFLHSIYFLFPVCLL